jgi:hypothetical protein
LIETSPTRNLAVLAVVACVLVAPVKGAGQTLQPLAERLMGLLRGGDAGRVAALLHYPPQYSPAERAQDEAGVREQLNFLLQRFGKISQAALAKDQPETLDLGVSGGTIAYFKSLGSFDTIDITYTTVFEHEGAGAVKISFLKLAEGWEPFKVSLCLPTSRSDARALWDEIVREMNAHMAEREVEL